MSVYPLCKGVSPKAISGNSAKTSPHKKRCVDCNAGCAKRLRAPAGARGAKYSKYNVRYYELTHVVILLVFCIYTVYIHFKN